MDEENKMAEKQDAQALEAFRIGVKLKELREKSGFTLHDLAAKTGFPKERLAEVESHDFAPPIAMLLKLGQALGVSMAYFFEDKAGTEKIAVTRVAERVRVTRRPHHGEGEMTYVYETLEMHKAGKHMEPFMVEFPALDTSDMVFVSHDGEEFLHLLDGQLEFRTPDRVEVLQPGDSIYFESDVSHSFRGLGERPARAIVIVWNRA
jgi:transcriptional regulator with XRE-family HTH domain